MDCAAKNQEEHHLEALLETLKASGLRVTQQRKELLSFLLASEKALSVQQIYAGLLERGVRVDEASVYRSIKMLKDIELVHELEAGMVSLCQHSKCKEHLHLSWLCDHCGQTQEPRMKVDDLEALQKILGYKKHKVSHVKINYLCADCR